MFYNIESSGFKFGDPKMKILFKKNKIVENDL